MVRTVALIAALTAVPGAAVAAQCRLALLLAMDVSSSVDAREDRLQRGGLAAALASPSVEAAVFASPLPVAIAVYEWSGRTNQTLLVDWTVIDNRAALLGVANAIAQADRSHDEFPTAIGAALRFAADMFQRGPACFARVLDVAGDGENNEGISPRKAYAQYSFGGVTVNGLVVEADDYEAQITLREYYQKNVLHGPGAFLEVAKGFDDYERAIRRKLERELRPRAIGGLGGATQFAPG